MPPVRDRRYRVASCLPLFATRDIAIAREPAGHNDRYVIDLNTGKLHLCNAKNAIAVWPKRPIVSVQMNLQSGTASMLTRSGPFAV
jgi:hypothetical protein